MKHLLLILVLLFVGYGLWHITPPKERNMACRLITRHGLRLGALTAAVVLLLAAAYYLSSTQLLG